MRLRRETAAIGGCPQCRRFGSMLAAAMREPPAPLDVRPLAPLIGAEVRDVDVARLDDEAFASVRSVLRDRLVVVFRDQRLTPGEQLAFAERFGEAEPPHPVFARVPEEPRVSVLESRGGEPLYTDEWHADTTFRAHPARGSLLYARVVPPVGGDTLWANMEAAYDALSTPVRSTIDGLTATHDIFGGGPYGRVSTYRDIVLGRAGGAARVEEIAAEYPPVSHPVVRVDPDTGRRALFVNRSFTTGIDGLAKLESAWLLGMLLEHAEQPAFQVRHRWNVDDLVVWENRATLHFAVADYAPAHRLMHRVTVIDDRPV